MSSLNFDSIEFTLHCYLLFVGRYCAIGITEYSASRIADYLFFKCVGAKLANHRETHHVFNCTNQPINHLIYIANSFRASQNQRRWMTDMTKFREKAFVDTIDHLLRYRADKIIILYASQHFAPK